MPMFLLCFAQSTYPKIHDNLQRLTGLSSYFRFHAVQNAVQPISCSGKLEKQKEKNRALATDLLPHACSCRLWHRTDPEWMAAALMSLWSYVCPKIWAVEVATKEIPDPTLPKYLLEWWPCTVHVTKHVIILAGTIIYRFLWNVPLSSSLTLHLQ